MSKEKNYITNAQLILKKMKPGKNYSRQDLADDLGLSDGDWKYAIQYLMKADKICQKGERRHTVYYLKAPVGSRSVTNVGSNNVSNNTTVITTSSTPDREIAKNIPQKSVPFEDEAPVRKPLDLSEQAGRTPAASPRPEFWASSSELGRPNLAATTQRAAKANDNNRRRSESEPAPSPELGLTARIRRQRETSAEPAGEPARQADAMPGIRRRSPEADVPAQSAPTGFVRRRPEPDKAEPVVLPASSVTVRRRTQEPGAERSLEPVSQGAREWPKKDGKSFAEPNRATGTANKPENARASSESWELPKPEKKLAQLMSEEREHVVSHIPSAGTPIAEPIAAVGGENEIEDNWVASEPDFMLINLESREKDSSDSEASAKPGHSINAGANMPHPQIELEHRAESSVAKIGEPAADSDGEMKPVEAVNLSLTESKTFVRRAKSVENNEENDAPYLRSRGLSLEETEALKAPRNGGKNVITDRVTAKSVAAKKNIISPHGFPVIGSLRHLPNARNGQNPLGNSATKVSSRIYVNPKVRSAPVPNPSAPTLQSVFPEHNFDQMKIRAVPESLQRPMPVSVKPRHVIKKEKLTPLPISSFRNSTLRRFEITHDELCENLHLSKDEVLLPLLLTDGINFHFWICLSAIANYGGGYIILGVRKRSDAYLIKGLRKSSTLKEDILDKIRDKKLISENILKEEDMKWTKVFKRNVLCIHVDKSSIPDKPIFVGENSFSKKPREGTFTVEAGEPVKCQEEFIREKWERYASPMEIEWPENLRQYVREKYVPTEDVEDDDDRILAEFLAERYPSKQSNQPVKKEQQEEKEDKCASSQNDIPDSDKKIAKEKTHQKKDRSARKEELTKKMATKEKAPSKYKFENVPLFYQDDDWDTEIETESSSKFEEDDYYFPKNNHLPDKQVSSEREEVNAYKYFEAQEISPAERRLSEYSASKSDKADKSEMSAAELFASECAIERKSRTGKKAAEMISLQSKSDEKAQAELPFAQLSRVTPQSERTTDSKAASKKTAAAKPVAAKSAAARPAASAVWGSIPEELRPELMELSRNSREIKGLQAYRQAEIIQKLCEAAARYHAAISIKELTEFLGKKEKLLREKTLPVLDEKMPKVHKTDDERYYFE